MSNGAGLKLYFLPVGLLKKSENSKSICFECGCSSGMGSPCRRSVQQEHPWPGESSLIKDPERFPLIRRMWDLMLTGLYTSPQILDLANREWRFRTRPTRETGGTPLTRSALYKIFAKPSYYGRFEYPNGSNNWYCGKHEPMVTEKEYNRVQTLFGRSGRAP